jgi:prolyl oligopeptidase
MKSTCFNAVAAVALLASTLFNSGCQTTRSKLSYPAARQTNQVDVYHGVAVADAFRWLEDDNSAETKDWVEAENRVTMAYLDAIPQRAGFKDRLTKLWNYERFGTPSKHGSRYFFSKNNGLQNQSVLYVTDTLDATPRVLLDPNTLSADGTVALSGVAISDDGNLMAYGLSSSGSDWQEWKVRDVRTGMDTADLIKWVKFSGASWTKDGKGFFYSRYDEPDASTKLTKVNYYQKLYYHRLGTPQSEDKLIYERKDQKEWGFGGAVTDDGRYLIIGVSRGTDPKNCVFYLDLQNPDAKVVELLPGFMADFGFVDNDGPRFWFRTDLDAPRARLISIDITKPARENWQELVPQTADTLTGVSTLNNQFVLTYLRDAATAVRICDLNGKPVREVQLPGLGSAGGFGGKRNETETFYSFTSYTVPGRIYRYDMATGASTLWREPKVDFNPDAYETKQVFYQSKDGTRVPMFLTYKKGLQLNSQNPTLLYGYGGFNISLTPSFSVANLAWLERGGVYAVANLRGGGEYGEDWHKAGTKLQKQNVFDDFIAAAEWLVANRYTSSAQAGDLRRQQRRPARRCVHDAAARPLRRGAARRSA